MANSELRAAVVAKAKSREKKTNTPRAASGRRWGRAGAIAPTLFVGLLSLMGTLVGSISGILTANRLTNYRIQELEKKVEKHNSIIERTTVVERDLKNAWRAIDELKEEMR